MAVNTYPHSGLNSMQDLIIAGLPTVAMQGHRGVARASAWALSDPGTHARVDDAAAAEDDLAESLSEPSWRSAQGSALYTRVGLTGLVALDEAEFVAKTAALMADHELRAAWRKVARSVDLSPLSDPVGLDKGAEAFPAVIDKLVRAAR